MDSTGESALPRSLHFPTSVGVMLGVVLCTHLAALVQVLMGYPRFGATMFIIGQFFLSIALLRLINGTWYLQDMRLLFVIFLFLYGGTLSIITLTTRSRLEGIAGGALMYATAFVGFNFVQWWYKQPWQDVPRAVLARIRPTFANAMLLTVTVVAMAAYSVMLGYRFGLTIDRTQSGTVTQLWVVLVFVVNGLAMYMFAGWPQLTRRAKLLVIVSVTAFVLLQLSQGNRRDFIPMFVFMAGVMATHKRATIGLKTTIAGFAAFVAMTLIGIIRQIWAAPVLLLNEPVRLLVTQNEFVSPIQTLMHYVASDRPLRWGWTYISAPWLFVPRRFWPSKPESLSLQFMRDAFGATDRMGYAYTPVTEAYLNFGSVGPFLVFAAYSLGIVWLVRKAKVWPGLYFLVFGFVVDFQRGEFGSTLYSLIIAGFAYWLMGRVSRFRWAPRRLRSIWPETAGPAHVAPVAD